MRAYGSTAQFADELEARLLTVYKEALNAEDGPITDAEPLARQHAAELARQLQDATANMLSEGKALGEVFGSDRAALVGLQEDNKARQIALGVAATAAKDEMLEWQTDANPCERICRKLNGKKRWPGKMFAVVDGKPVYHAPAHVSCKCRTVRIKVSKRKR